MSNDQSNVHQGTNPDRVGQQISLHQSGGDTSTWVTMNVQSIAPIKVNAFTTAPITINTYAGTAIKINVIDPPASEQVDTLQNREASEVIDADASDEVGQAVNLSHYSFQHVHWTSSGYVEDNLPAVEHETAFEPQPDVESDSFDEGEPWTPDSDGSEVSDSEEGEDEDDNRSTTAEIGEPTEGNLLAYGNPFRLAPHLLPISNYPYLPISTGFIKSAIYGSRQGRPAFLRSVLCDTRGSRPLYTWHCPYTNGRIQVPEWDYILVSMEERILARLSAVGATGRYSHQDEFLNVDIDDSIDVQLDFTLPESAGHRVLAWAKRPAPGGDWYWYDIQGRVVQKNSDFSENHDSLWMA